jgi:hypothetical protein
MVRPLATGLIASFRRSFAASLIIVIVERQDQRSRGHPLIVNSIFRDECLRRGRCRVPNRNDDCRPDACVAYPVHCVTVSIDLVS